MPDTTTPAGPVHILLGNTAALDRAQPIPGNQITSAGLPSDEDGWTDEERFQAVTDTERGMGIWVMHSTAPAPAWVESSDPEFAQRIATHYGCPVGRPSDWA